jgi:DNA invertase Pin-like site-specific DNA recombinase
LRSVNEPISDDCTGKLMENILAAMAQFDNDQKSERTKAGMLRPFLDAVAKPRLSKRFTALDRSVAVPERFTAFVSQGPVADRPPRWKQ